MSSVKCNSCNVVISEVLAFIQTKLEVMDEISLVQLCASAFTASDITDAKNLLFDCLKSSKKKSQRKRDGKSRKDLEDIVQVFRELDPNEFPVFVVRDINKLPPVHFDHIDVSRLLRDLLVLQKEVTSIKQNYALSEELVALKNDVENIKTASIVNNFEMTNVNAMRRGRSKLTEFVDINSYNSGPIGLLHISEPLQTTASPENENMPSSANTSRLFTKPSSAQKSPPPATYHEITLNNIEDTARLLPTPIASTEVSKPFSTSPPRKSFAQLARDEGEWRDKQPSEEWKIVQRKRYRNRLETSKGEAIVEAENKFKAADIKVPLFINNVDKCASAIDISNYISLKTNVEVSLEKIKSKQVREYDAYKIMVPRSKLSIFMDAKLWPDGISFRRFVSLYRRHEDVSRDRTKP